MAAIIFDFDGTIADSFDFVADFLADTAGLPPLDEEQKGALRGHSMVAMARRLGYSWWRLPWLLHQGRRRMGRTIKHVQPFADMPEAIEKLHAEGHELFIVSSNTARNVSRFLHQHELHKHFLEIDGGIGMFGKAGALRLLLRKQHLNRQDALYIGDELRDVQAAQSLKLRVIAVAWGFARTGDLEALKPTALARQPADLIRIIEEL